MTYTIANGYATLADVKAELDVTDANSVDDDVLSRCIEDASRAIDAYCGGRRFYAASATSYLDCPDGDRTLWLDQDYLSVASVTNGDGAAVAASLYDLWPRNSQAKSAIKLKPSSGVSWTTNTAGDDLGVIVVSGSAGYVDRAASDASSGVIVSNTRRACIVTALAMYRKRFGIGSDAATVTAAGVVLLPQGLPRDAAQLIVGYRILP